VASDNGVCRFCANESKENKYMNKGNEVHEENNDVNSVVMNLNGNVNGESLLDIELDMSELLELRNMAIGPWVRQLLSTVVVKLEKQLMFRKCKMQNEVALKPKKSYSEAVSNIRTNFSTNDLCTYQHDQHHTHPMSTETSVMLGSRVYQ
jgi:hypothetical protein